MKVLIISHNPVSDQSNMGKTFLSLFSGFRTEELCQLYIYPTIPNSRVCNSYYRVTDKEALGSLLFLRKIGGVIAPQQIHPGQGVFEKESDRGIYRSRKNKSPIRRLLRDAIWKLAPWYSKDLRQWLDQEKPDCIFVAPGVAKFLYDFALRISRDRKIPMTVYLGDEYYFVREGKTWLGRLQQKLLWRKMETLLQRAASLAVVSQEMQALYSTAFGIRTTVLMNGSDITPTAGTPTAPQSISYFGNIRCNRFVSLGHIGKVLDEINRRDGTDYKLKIYTGEQDRQILASLRRFDSVQIMGFVTGAEFEKCFLSSDLLLHTEAFDEDSVDFTQHSVSTKIADCLASGVPLVAYGPAQISSMAHLIRNDCAVTVTSPEELEGALRRAFSDPQEREHVRANGLLAAKKYHDRAAIGAQMRSLLEDSCRLPKVLQVNSLYGRHSTGKITQLVHEGLRRRGYPAVAVYGRGADVAAPGVIRLCPDWYGKLQGLLVRLGGLPYGGCLLSTWRLFGIIRAERPDIVHLQCINGHFVNIYRLLEWLKREKIPVVVSLHGEFLYTGSCGHAFDCGGWRNGCRRCGQGYPRAARAWKRMAGAFAGLADHAVICPVSDWTGERAKQSKILQDFSFRTVHNGVDAENVFYGDADQVRQENAVLHVTAHFFGRKEHAKGGWYLLELAKRMPDVRFYVAGRTDKLVDIPENVTLLGQIADSRELAAWYRRVKLTVLTSRRETYGMPCAESICCGTPVVGFRAGGPEEIALPQCSTFVDFGDLDGLERAVRDWLLKPTPRMPSAREVYGGAQMLRALEEVYRKLHGNDEKSASYGGSAAAGGSRQRDV